MKNVILFATVLLFSACSSVDSVEPTASDTTLVSVPVDSVVVEVDTVAVDSVAVVK